jgi:hypothetical protein
MPKVLVLYYSTYGYIEAMAQAIAKGLTGGDGSRLPSGNELAAARHQGELVAQRRNCSVDMLQFLQILAIRTAVDLVQPHSHKPLSLREWSICCI